MYIFRIIAIGLVGGILAVTVRQYKPEYGVLTAICTAAVILFFTLDTLSSAIDRMMKLTEQSGVDIKYITAVIKVVGVAYITQFGAEMLRDCGEGAIAMKVEMAGKVCILGLTLPVAAEFLEVCINALSAV